MHLCTYAFDVWMTRNHQEKPWCRYADDGIAHCRTKWSAEKLLAELNQRLVECGLELHSEKTKIVYCQDGERKGYHQSTKFKKLSGKTISIRIKDFLIVS
jgi:RNA-directed DNA polymerase